MEKSSIVRFSYEAMKNNTHVAFQNDVLTIFVTFTPEGMKLTVQYNRYKAAVDNEKTAWSVLQGSDTTPDITAGDTQRDGTIRGLMNLLRGFQRHFDPNKRDAAQRLLTLLRQHGNIYDLPLPAENSAIDFIIVKVSEPEYKAMVDLLGISDWFAQLDTENRAVKDLMLGRDSELALRPLVQMRAARRETDKALRDVLDQLEALIRVDGLEAYEGFLKAYNVKAIQYRDQLAQQLGRSKASEPEVAAAAPAEIG